MNYFDILLAKKLNGGGAAEYFINPPVPKEKDYAYTGEPLTFEFDAIDTEHCIVTGGTETEAGTYTVTVSLVENAYWTDTEDNTPKTFIWEIIRIYNYGFHINGAESDPSAKVTYLADAVGMTPAHMDFANDRFDYGSWENAFFMPKPCILNQDGTVRCYLDPNDYEKDIDGNTVAIDSTLTGANVMVEFPKIWYKIIPDVGDNTSANIYISNYNIDGEYKDYAYIASDGVTHKEKMYMSAFISSYSSGSNKSIVGTNINSLQSVSNMNTLRSYVNDNGVGWDIMAYCDYLLIAALFMLLFRSTNSQSSLGVGLNGQTLLENYTTGDLKKNGLFYGNQSGGSIKLFGIENYYGLYCSMLGLKAYRLNVFRKMCYGISDGTKVSDYNFTAGQDGYSIIYTHAGSGADHSGFIKNIAYEDNNFYISALGGADSTFYADYYCSDFLINSNASYYGQAGLKYNRVNNPGCMGIFAISLWNRVDDNAPPYCIMKYI